MQNVNTQWRQFSRLNSMHVLAFRALLPKAMKAIPAVAALLLCCFSQTELAAQPCNTTPSITCKIDNSVNIYLDGNGNAQVNFGDVVASSSPNCSGSTIYTVNPPNVSCSSIPEALITATITNSGGYSASCSMKVNVIDNTAPVISCPPNKIYTSCSSFDADPSVTGFPQAVDNCGGLLGQNGPNCSPSADGVTYCDTPTGCAGPGILRTWTARYAGKSSTCVQTIDVNDTTKPVFDWNGASPGLGTPPPATVNITCADLPYPAAIGYTANDNCGATILPISDISTQGSDPSKCNYYAYTITRTYRAKDNCGNEVPYVQTINVADKAPVIGGVSNVSISAGPDCEATLSNLNASITGGCADPAHLAFSWIMTNDYNPAIVYSDNGDLNANGTYPAGEYTLIYAVATPCITLSQKTISVKILDNVPPSASCFSGPLQVSIPPTGTTSLTVAQVNNSSTDNCTPSADLVFVLENNVFDCDDVGSPTETVTLKVTDAKGNFNSCTVSVNVVNNSPPAVFCKDTTVYLDTDGVRIVNAKSFDNGSFDNCDNHAPPSGLQFRYVEINGDSILPPAGLNTFDCSHIGVNTVKIRIRERDRDQSPNYVNDGYCTQTLMVLDSISPTAVCNNITIPLNQDGMVSVYDPRKFSGQASGLGLTIPDDDLTGVSDVITVGVPDDAPISRVKVFLKVTHPRVGDLRATLESPSGTIITLFDRPGYPANPPYGCTGEDLDVSFSDLAFLTNAVFEGACGSLPAIFGEYQPIDALSAFAGELLNGSWTLTVYDGEAVETGSLEEWGIVIEYGSYLAMAGNGSSDNCEVTWDIVPNMMDCSNIHYDPLLPDTVHYTLTATDLSGNTATCGGIITIIDTIAPVISCEDRSISIDHNGSVKVYAEDFVSGGIYLSSGNSGSGSDTTQYCFTAPNLMTFGFNWEYVTQGEYAGCDPFGYTVNSAFTQLTTGDYCPPQAPPYVVGTRSQAGMETITLHAGQVFCFQVKTLNNDSDRAEVWVTNFSPTFNDDFEPGKWSFSNTNANGVGFFYEACGVKTWEIQHSYDGGTTWSSWAPYSTFDCSDIDSTIIVNIKAADGSGNFTECGPAQLTIIDKQPPIASCDEFTTNLNLGGETIVLASSFDDGSIDQCSNPVSFRFSDDGDNNFYPSITYDCDDLGVLNIALEVTDTAGNKAYCATTLTIQDKLGPIMTCPADIAISCSAYTGPAPDSSMTGLATAVDNCILVTPTYKDQFLPNSGNFNDPDCRIVKRTWTATDDHGNKGLCFQNITIYDDVRPVFDWTGKTQGDLAPGNTIVNYCSIPVAPVPGSSDNCDENILLTYTEVDSRMACPPPSGTNNCFTPAVCGYYNYTLTRTWKIEDNCGNYANHVQVDTVQDAQSPVIDFPSSPPLQFFNNPNQCAGAVSVNLLDYVYDCAAADQYLTVSYQKLPGGAVINSSEINVNLSVGEHKYKVVVSDPCTNSATDTLTIIVRDNQSPTAKCKSGPVTVSLNSSGVAPLSPDDVDNGSTDNCGIVSRTINPSYLDCTTNPNPHPVTLTVQDAAGNMNICTTMFLVEDNTPPTVACPFTSPTVVSCEDFDPSDPTTSQGFAVGSSACGAVAPTYVDATVSGTATNCRTIERTWTVTTVGGTASCVQTIRVEDYEPATLIGVPIENDTVNACNIPAPPVVTANDNCASPGVNYVQTSTQIPDPSLPAHYNYTLTRTWSTSDGCQASPTTGAYLVVVQDTTRPEIAIPNPLVIYTNNFDCISQANINLLDYISDCAEDPYLTVSYNSTSTLINTGAAVISAPLPVGDYPVTVTAVDPSGNTSSKSFTLRVEDNTAPQAACKDAVTLVLDGGGNGSLTYSDIDNGSSDNCGSITMSIAPASFTSADIGVNYVVLTVTDDAGNQKTCTTPVTVMEGVLVKAGEVTGTPGSSVNIPVSVDGFNSICALSFSLHVPNTGAATVAGIDLSGSPLSGILPGDFNIVGNDITFNWIDLGGNGVTLTPHTIIFNIEVTMGSVPGSVSPVVINNSPTDFVAASCPGIIPVSVAATNGSVEVVASISNYHLAGVIEQGNGTPVQLSVVSLTGTTLGNQTTGAPGAYNFTVPSGSNSTITPSKDINDCNGVNVFDLVVIQEHILGTTLLPTFYRYIAADINRDNKVNVLDRLALHILITTGTPGDPCPGLPANTSWRFVDASWTPPALPITTIPSFPEAVTVNPVTADHTDIDFIGVKIGDLDDFGLDPTKIVGSGSGVDQAIGGLVVNRNSNLEFALDDYAIKAGNEYRVSFRAKDFSDLIAYQYTLGFDQTKLQFKDIEIGALPELEVDNFGTIGVADGFINAIWYRTEGTSMADGDILYTFVFEALRDADKLSDLLFIQALPLQSMAAKIDMIPYGVSLSFESVTGTAEPEGGKIALFQNRPNPFGNETVIPFQLPQAAHATLTVTDISGKVVKVLEGDFNAGRNEFRIERKELLTSGVFFYRLDTFMGSAVKKMVLID